MDRKMYSASLQGHLVFMHNNLSLCVSSGAHDLVFFIASFQGNGIHIREDVSCITSETRSSCACLSLAHYSKDTSTFLCVIISCIAARGVLFALFLWFGS